MATPFRGVTDHFNGPGLAAGLADAGWGEGGSFGILSGWLEFDLPDPGTDPYTGAAIETTESDSFENAYSVVLIHEFADPDTTLDLWIRDGDWSNSVWISAKQGGGIDIISSASGTDAVSWSIGANGLFLGIRQQRDSGDIEVVSSFDGATWSVLWSEPAIWLADVTAGFGAYNSGSADATVLLEVYNPVAVPGEPAISLDVTAPDEITVTTDTPGTDAVSHKLYARAGSADVYHSAYLVDDALPYAPDPVEVGGLAGATTYHFGLEAVNAAGSSYSAVVSETTPGAPGVPTVTLTPLSATQILITPTAGAGALDHDLYVGLSPIGMPLHTAGMGATPSPVTLSGLAPGSTRHARLRAINGEYHTDGPSSSATTPQRAVTVSGITASGATVALLHDTEATDVQFQTALASDPTFASPVDDETLDGAGRYSHAVTGRDPSTAHLTRVRVKMAGVWQAWIDPVAWSTLAAPLELGAPGAPTVTVTNIRHTTATFTTSPFVADSEEPPALPVASFTWIATDLSVAFDASESTSGVSITGYAWDFGDGSPAGSGATPNHVYDEPGTYEVTLTITDALSRTDEAVDDVVVTEDEDPPVGTGALLLSDIDELVDPEPLALSGDESGDLLLSGDQNEE